MIKKTAIKRITAVLFAVVVLCSALCFPSSAASVNGDIEPYIHEFGQALNVYPYFTAKEDYADYWWTDATSYICAMRNHEATSSAWAFNEIYHTVQRDVAYYANEANKTVSEVVDGVFVWDDNAVEWNDITDDYYYDAADRATHGCTPDDTIYMQMYANDAILDVSGSFTFKVWAEQAIKMRSLTYMLNGSNPFCVRYHFNTTDKTTGENSEVFFAYFVFPFNSTDEVSLDPAPVYDIGNNYPAQIYQRNAEERTEQYVKYEEQIKTLEAEKTEAYKNGYNAGAADAGGGLAVDTSDPANTMLGFMSVLFKALRDFIFPFLNIEFLGISIGTAISGVAVIALVILVVFFISKVIRG